MCTWRGGIGLGTWGMGSPPRSWTPRGIRLGILTRRRLCGEELWGGLVLAEEGPAWGALSWGSDLGCECV